MVNPILLIALPLFFAFSIPIVGFVYRPLQRWIPVVSLGLTTLIALSLIPRVGAHGPIVVITGGFPPPIAINLTVGPLGLLLALLIQVVGLLTALYLVQVPVKEPHDRFSMLFLLLLLGATGMVLTGDAFNLFVFLEITSIAAYALTGFQRTGESVEAAFKYLVIGSIGSTLYLLGLILLYTQTGTLNLADIARHLHQVDPRILYLSLALIAVAFGVEAEMFPLNGWAPDAYQGAPVAVTALFSAVIAKAGLYALLRMLYTLFGVQNLLYVLALLGVLTLLVAEAAALRQRNVRRMLAYSSIGQMGLLMLAFGVGSSVAVSSGLFHVLNHAVFKGILFLGLGLMALRTGSENLEDLAGLGRRMPWVSLLFAVAILGTLGLPPLSGFWSKFFILYATARAKFYGLLLLALLGSVLEAAYYLRLLQVLYFQEPQKPLVPGRTPWLPALSLGVLAVLLLLFSAFPHQVFHLVRPAATELLNRGWYISKVLATGGL